MPLNVCLINCAVGVAGFNRNWPNRRAACDREGSWIGHGIASVGAAAKAAGHRVELIDLRQLPGFDRLGQQIAWTPADVYGLSVSSVDEYAALMAIAEVKKNAPNAKIVVGGIMPTIFPEKFDFQIVDAIIRGEGEVTFPAVLGRIERGEPFERIQRGEKPHLDMITWVDRTLFDYRRELECFFAPGQAVPSVTMLAGRGCPYACNYCQPAENAVFGKPYRMRSVENVIAELETLKRRYNFKSVTFWDDTFTFRRDWIFEFCDQWEAKRFGATIAACSRADIICNHPDMVKRMAQVGVDWFVIGIESGSQRILDLISKGTTVEQNREAIRICREVGIKVFGTFMLGLPTETPDESKATIDFINETQPALASPFWFHPIPGTGIYDYCERHDLILPEAKDYSIARTGVFVPTIKGIDYDYIKTLMPQLTGF